MNYYNPNLYQNFPYPNNGQYVNSYQSPQNMINGKIVDTIEMVKVTEVPIGGYGIFPKADLSEVYIKTWNPNGTTNITIFKPSLEEKPIPRENELTVVSGEILQKLDSLNLKLDDLTKSFPRIETHKKEIKVDDY